MSSSYRNRGKQASDDRLFAPEMLAKMKEALSDLSFLLTRGYAEKSSLQLVGNRYKLNVRQQKAIQGMAASKQQVSKRAANEITEVQGTTVAIDGFNLIILLESALSGAFVFKGMDGTYRDLSGVHGTYKRVQQTTAVFKLVGDQLKELGIQKAIWYFDAPVSNSGRLKTLLMETAKQETYPWEVYLENNPDKVLAESEHVVVSSDAWVLDHADRSFNLGAYLIDKTSSQFQVIELELV